MNHFDDFFKANYLRMTRYCASCGFNMADVEEEVSSAIHTHYDEFRAKITSTNVDSTLRGWLNRRAMLNLKSRHRLHANSRVDAAGDDGIEVLHFDTPESIVCLSQRLPRVDSILVDYEQHADGVRKSGKSSTEASKFCRARKAFMGSLASGVPLPAARRAAQ